MVELFGDVLSEGVAGTPRWDAPARAVVRVRPKQVTHGALVGDLLHAVKRANLVQTIEGWRETAVEAEDFLLDDSSEGQVIEEIREVLPHVSISVLAQALVVEAVHLGDLARFVVASQDCHTVLVANFQTH